MDKIQEMQRSTEKQREILAFLAAEDKKEFTLYEPDLSAENAEPKVQKLASKPHQTVQVAR